MTIKVCLPALLLAFGPSLHSQTTPDPADATQSGLPASYRSAFDGYLSHQEPSKPSLDHWRAANDEVGRLKGHGGHIRAAQSAHDHNPASAPSTPISEPMEHDHGGHHAH